MSANDKDVPGVIAPPPLIYLGFLLGGFLIDFFFPVAVLPNSVQYVLGFALIGAGLIVFASAIREFAKAGTNIPTRKPALVVVTSGPYRYTRNPIYVGISIFYAGIAVAADSIWVLALLLPALAIIQRGVILREEGYLERKFGEEYRQYKASRRR